MEDMKEYDHKKIEKKWQTTWEKKGIYHAQNQEKNKSKKPKYYSLIEFPYPSGAGLHVGHIRSNTAMDIISRKRRMEGFNVLYPMGWDAFGLPTENYAIKTGIHPIKVTKDNTDTFRRQLKSIGFSFDWSREVNTTDPKYYKWTQWIFLEFYKKGLAYKTKTTINWCPKDKIGLANEEVVTGCCERCGTPVEKREKEQWMLAITKYAERLDKDLDTVDYMEKIKIQQRNWIGKREGAEINFAVDKHDITVFTTRPDTIFGVTFIAVSAEMAKTWLDIGWGASDEVRKYIKKILEDRAKNILDKEKGEPEKTGIASGFDAINPANKERVPVWIVNYVLGDVGTGAIMGVPAHDERDFEFAKKYNLPIKQVVKPVYVDKINALREGVENTKRNIVIVVVKHWSEDKYLLNASDKFGWKVLFTGGIEEGEDPVECAKREIREETGYKNFKSGYILNFTHTDKFYAPHKGVNRDASATNIFLELTDGEKEEISPEEKALHQISWKTESEMIKEITHDNHRFVFEFAVRDGLANNWPGVLLNSGEFSGIDSEKAKQEIIKFVGGKEKTTFKLRDWVFSRQRYWGEPIPLINCPKDGWVPVPEKDLPVVLPKVAKYKPTDNGESPLAGIKSWVNVKCPKCKGPAQRETDTMPNWAGSSWYFLRFADPKNNKEFASKKSLNYWTPVDWYNGGNEHTTLHLLYSRFWHKFLYDLKLVPTSEPYMKRTSHGMILAAEGEKMSKSKGNTVNPDDLVKTYGADTLRMYEMFMGPFDQAVSWNTDSMIGPRRFLERVWKISTHLQKNSSVSKLLNKTIKKVSEDIEEMRFNTAISALMILVTEMEKAEVSFEDYKKFLQILAPFAPHITEELWEMLKEKKPAPHRAGGSGSGSIHLSKWPKWEESLIKDEEIKIAVQINGKVRAETIIQMDEKEEDVKKKVLSDEAVLKYIVGKELKKVIYIKNRLINIVI